MIKAFTFGASADYSVAKSALSKYAAACQYVSPEFIVATNLSEAIGKPDGMVYTGSYYHKVTPKMQVRGHGLGAAQLDETPPPVGAARTAPRITPTALVGSTCSGLAPCTRDAAAPCRTPRGRAQTTAGAAPAYDTPRAFPCRGV
eukprot:scaffold6711_cov118-Isochrysis_galbana.AAC.31